MDGYRNVSELYSYMAFLKYYTHKLYTYIMAFSVTTVRGLHNAVVFKVIMEFVGNAKHVP